MLKLSPKQLEAIQQADSRLVVYEGAVRSGKSYSALWKFVEMCRKAPEGALVVCGKSQGSLKRNIIDELDRLFGAPYVKYSPGKQEMYLMGRQVHVIGASDERAVTKIKGATFSGGLGDEATELPESFFSMLDSRLSRPGAQLVLTTNPDSPFHWLKKNFLDRASEVNLKSFKFVLDDNPSLDEFYKEHLKSTYRGLWYKRYIMGEWCLAEGSVYDFFHEDEHVIDLAPTYAKYFLVGVDYGTTNPCAFTMVGFNDEVFPNIWVEKEYYFNSREEGYQKTDADYAQDLARFVDGYPVKRIYIDPSAASFKVEIRRAAPKLSVLDAKNDVLNGIRVVSKHLAVGNLKIKSCCRNLISEFQSYVWDSKKAAKGIDEPVKANDHALDSLRYTIFTHFGQRENLREKSLEERELEMAQRAYKNNPGAYMGYGWQKL